MKDTPPAVASSYSLDSLLYLQTHVVVRPHQFFEDFNSFVAKSHTLPNVTA
jgi:hypothetical protein